METSTLLNKISKPIGGTGDNYNEKNSGKLYRDKVPPCVDPVVHVSISKAEKRLKKLERDYQNTYKNYTETQLNWRRFNIEARQSKFRIRRETNCIMYYKNLRGRLQNNLDKLNKAEATQKGTEKHDHKKKFLHGCKSLTQEKKIIQQIGERQYPETTDLSQETINRKEIGWGYQSLIPECSSKKPIHDLLRRVKETDNLREMAIANDKLAGNPTSEDSMKISIKMEIKLLTKVIQKLEKERCDMTRWDYCWDGQRFGCGCMTWNEEEKKYVAGYQKKMTHLAKQFESIREKCDEEKMTHLAKQCENIVAVKEMYNERYPSNYR